MDPNDETGCVTFLVRHAWLSMRSALAVALDEHGLSVQQYGTLLCVREEPGLTVAEVGRMVGTTRQSANELITGMERAGLVERRPNPKDRRTQQVHLTPGGERRLAEAGPAIRKVEDDLEAAFSKTDRATARAWLAHMVTAVEG
ncbi:MarR family winged helix-turn-helix transcriptional regulator [Kribbella shirazensis]|jgi:DNA-binding MarR family transcriptional regulator|uniref:DNA-binding MarR family transcriptional regulator n=1 Tax=Kribbella shirazensis TaxID=1105143 RepID=A0A7X5V7L3_9ACTN|nr:MarR family transcriptional regulator [Kribbella shirazensis]NIK55844.1 DNA-binding MarR family transcriptional regulator [Kribbella shirazensis]